MSDLIRENHEPGVEYNLDEKQMSDIVREDNEDLKGTNRIKNMATGNNPVVENASVRILLTMGNRHSRQRQDDRPVRSRDLPSCWNNIRGQYDHEYTLRH